MARPTDSDRPGQLPDTQPGPAPATGGPAPYRALLVEDHAALAEATAELMRLHGLDVSIVSSGRDALKAAEAFDPVLVLCDLSLSDMTGLDVAQALRARRGASDFLTVILSAMSADDLRAIEGDTRTSGVTLFCPKPLTSQILIDLIARLDALRPSVVPTRLA